MKKVLMLLCACAVLSACASGGSGTAESKLELVPAGSKLAKIQMGMSDEEVRAILGSPDNSRNYMTGKQFIPFYFGPDTHRSDWVYEGVGRVVFRRNRYSGGLEVIQTRHDPGAAGD